MRTSRAGTSARTLTFPVDADRSFPTGGFTLVELVVVIAILAAIAALVLPKIASTGRGELRCSARKLAASLRYVEDLAVTTRTGYRLHVDLEASTLRFTKVLPEGGEQPADDPLLRRETLSRGITISDVVTSNGKVSTGEVVAEFSPLGAGDPVTIHLRSPGGEIFTVETSPHAGKVSVFDNYSGSAL